MSYTYAPQRRLTPADSSLCPKKAYLISFTVFKNIMKSIIQKSSAQKMHDAYLFTIIIYTNNHLCQAGRQRDAAPLIHGFDSLKKFYSGTARLFLSLNC